MRWKCPHCKTDLAVSDETLGTDWTFSRCYRCNGYALVRAQDNSLIRLEKSRDSDELISSKFGFLPQPSPVRTPKVIPSTKAKKILSRKAAFEEAAKAKEHLARRLPEESHVRGASAKNSKIRSKSLAQKPDLPEPLPIAPPSSGRVTKVLPLAIGIAGLVAVASGIYLYIQGEILWKKARKSISTTKNHKKLEILPITPVTATKSKAAIEPVSQMAGISDNVHQKAMAPDRTQGRKSAANSAPPKTAEEVSDYISGKLKRTDLPSLIAKIRSKYANVRSGPGLDFPVVAFANPNQRFVVIGWEKSWLRLINKDSFITASRDSEGMVPDSVWIRNDLLEVIPSK